MIAKTNSLLKSILWAASFSVAFNLVVFFLSSKFGFVSESILVESPQGGMQPIDYSTIIGATLTFCLLGSLVFWILNRFTEHAAPWFLGIALIFLMISLLFPFTIEHATTSMIITLETMHIGTAFLLLVHFIPNSFRKI
jgi:hypothetical protein